MRASCEQCATVQPPGWQAGDLCTFCGQAVRHEVRCFWCTNWTPAVAFCRSCGADIVEGRLYGAARMLKDAGTDRFTVPRLLAELGDDRVENFTRVYQRHAVVAARHVDELNFVEAFLHDQHWSAALDDELAAQLPWEPSVLERCSVPLPLTADQSLARVCAIHDSTPFETTRQLALLARLALDDWSAYTDAGDLFGNAPPAVRAEAALVLTSWRVRTAVGSFEGGSPLVEELRRSPFQAAAAVRLAVLDPAGSELPADDLLAADPDASFAAALIRGDVDRLSAALAGDVVGTSAAGAALVRCGVLAPLARPLREGPDAVRESLLAALARSKWSTLPIREALIEIVETSEDHGIRRRATQMACRALDHVGAMRIARVAADDRAIVQSLLQCTLLESHTVVELADLLLANGTFTSQQYGISTVAQDGRLPNTFVPTRFHGQATSPQHELLLVAEVQLGQREDETLHCFVMNVVFGEHPAATRAAAWWVLHRWYRSQGDIRGEGPFVLHVDSVCRFFETVDAFVPKLESLIRNDAVLHEVGVYEFVANLLSTADEAFVAALQADGRLGLPLVDALGQALLVDLWPILMESMVKMLAGLGSLPTWRERALASVLRVSRAGNYHYDRAVESLTLRTTTLPTE